MFERKNTILTIAAIIILLIAFTYTTKKLQTPEQPIQTQSVEFMGMNNVTLVETPSAQNYIINGNRHEKDRMDNNLFAEK